MDKIFTKIGYRLVLGLFYTIGWFLLGFVWGPILHLLWNQVVPPVFDGPSLSLWQSVCGFYLVSYYKPVCIAIGMVDPTEVEK